jgi:hypothetical protein
LGIEEQANSPEITPFSGINMKLPIGTLTDRSVFIAWLIDHSRVGERRSTFQLVTIG